MWTGENHIGTNAAETCGSSLTHFEGTPGPELQMNETRFQGLIPKDKAGVSFSGSSGEVGISKGQ